MYYTKDGIKLRDDVVDEVQSYRDILILVGDMAAPEQLHEKVCEYIAGGYSAVYCNDKFIGYLLDTDVDDFDIKNSLLIVD